ncbi:hypothetical protein [Aurantiacibacter sediminis]|uniref:Uncharacterized protein n=1 Tax=Aurantiacibacter sediminis TaxID=2793064 RepID=A0ABS0N3Z8_9SPHN|nr:hypothetical protein [Aurantiacibacter sediminis]MBH5322452.1 hypothetical protein [Aurantiacibacter sediminis]
MNELNEKIRVLADAEERLGEAIAAREEKLKELSDQKETLAGHRGEVARLEDEMAQLAERIDAKEGDLENLRSEREETRTALEETFAELAQVTNANAVTEINRQLQANEKAFTAANEAFARSETELARLAELRDRATTEHRRKMGVVENGEGRVTQARDESRTAATAVNQAEAAVGEAISDLADAIGSIGNGHVPQIDPQVVKLLSQTGKDRRRDFLDIRTRSTSLDDLAQSAVDTLADESEEMHPRERLRDVLLEHGIATDIGKVTARINGARQSDIRRSITAAVFPSLVARRVIDDGVVNEDAAKDTIGLADTILLDLESDQGPLDRYAALLADKAISDMRLDAGPGTPQRQLITAQLRASL